MFGGKSRWHSPAAGLCYGVCAAFVACGGDRELPSIDGVTAAAGESGSSSSDGPGGAEAGSSSSTGSDPGPDEDEALPDPVRFDLGTPLDAPAVVPTCGAPDPVVCDGDDDDPWRAMGLNCDGGPAVEGVYHGDPRSLHVHEGNLGTFVPPPFPPREGGKMVVLSSGWADQLPRAMPMNTSADVNGYVDGDAATLPDPLRIQPVSPTQTCVDDPTLVGTGDCSNTIAEQWNEGGGANDLAELRFTTEVPAASFGFSYDLAFFSTEYPDFFGSQFNDMYIAWLESEGWTGNVSFDETGNPISLNAGFLDYKDAEHEPECPMPCEAPELQGTAMRGHAATKWLTTSAPVIPGDTIELVFTIFDLSDGSLDSYVLLDNFLWACEGGPPSTIPG